MTRSLAARTPHLRSQRRLLAAGTRIRGQWRYLVRATRDPFAEVGSASAAGSDRGAGKRPCERVGEL